MKLILGSSSIGRRELMTAWGFKFEVQKPDIDEKAIRHSDAAQMALQIAEAKIKALQDRLKDRLADCVILTSDQVIVCDGEARERPADAAQCRQFLKSYSRGLPAQANCAVVVFNGATGKTVSGVEQALQFFKPMTDQQINEFITEGSVMDCAGGFCIEKMGDRVGAWEGEVSTVVGLPRSLCLSLLKQNGVEPEPHVALKGADRQAALARVPLWSEVDGRDAIERKFQFQDFAQAWAFMSQIAQAAEKRDHHPEWFNVYNRVEVTLATHDAGGLSRKDIELASVMDQEFQKYKKRKSE